MRKSVVLSAVLLLCISAHSSASIDFESQKPRFAKISVTRDDSKTMLLAFDESKGTSTGYDTLYADTNFNGKLEPSEKLTAQCYPARDATSYVFQRMELSVPFTSGDKDKKLNSISFRSRKYTPQDAPSKDEFTAALTESLKADPRGTVIYMSISLWPSTDLAHVKLDGFNKEPEINLTVKPDSSRPGQTGIIVFFKVGKWDIRKSWPTTLTIKDAKGGIVNNKTGDMSDFSYG